MSIYNRFNEGDFIFFHCIGHAFCVGRAVRGFGDGETFETKNATMKVLLCSSATCKSNCVNHDWSMINLVPPYGSLIYSFPPAPPEENPLTSPPRRS
jgi:hypothetical protein